MGRRSLEQSAAGGDSHSDANGLEKLVDNGGRCVTEMEPVVDVRKNSSSHDAVIAERHAAYFESSPSASLILSPEGDIEGANPAAASLLGRDSVGDLSNLNMSSFLADSSSDELRCFINEASSSESPCFALLALRSRDDYVFPAFLTGVSFKGPSEKRQINVGVFNMADLRPPATAMDKYQRKPEYRTVDNDKILSLGLLIPGLAHEINNPANCVLMGSSLIKKIWGRLVPILRENEVSRSVIEKEDLENNVPKILQSIEEGSFRISEVVNSIENYARKKQATVGGVADLNECLRESLVLLKNLLKKNVSGHNVEYGSGLPPLSGDKRRIVEAIVLLVINFSLNVECRNHFLRVRTFPGEGGGAVLEFKCEKRPECDEYPHIVKEEGELRIGLESALKILNEHKARLNIKSGGEEGKEIRIEFEGISEGE